VTVRVSGFEYMTVMGDFITADIIAWRRYRCRCDGIFETMLDLNPHLAHAHRISPFIPVGTQVRIPIDYEALKMRPKQLNRDYTWTEAKGYRL
jgi:phage tail protein X